MELFELIIKTTKRLSPDLPGLNLVTLYKVILI